MTQKVGDPIAGRIFEGLALLLCMALAAVMILNTQMGGEAMWFWYGTVFGRGAKLYSELHTALQPLFVLETSEWLHLFGNRIALYEVPSFLHACILAVGIYLILRESTWPDWQKGILLFGTFVYIVAGHSYRFDDYHVVAEALIVYALLLLLQIGRPGQTEVDGPKLVRVAALGLVCGLTIVTRITDGAAIALASGVSLLFLLRKRRAASIALLVVVAALTVLLVVKLTGDTFSAYLSSSIFRAASSKGGTGSIFAAPLLVFGNTLQALRGKTRMTLVFLFAIGVPILVSTLWKRAVQYIVPMQLLLFVLVYVTSHGDSRAALRKGSLFEFPVLVLTVFMYVLAAIVIVRFIQHVRGKGSWDSREALIMVPILEWASYSAGAAAEPLTNYYAPVALLILLFPVLEPLRRYKAWLDPTVIALTAAIAMNGVGSKILVPYSWQNYKYPAMFRNREWYQHPVYGKMYIDRDLLQFSERVCQDIGAVPGKPGPPLLSLPYPYPNYFCDTPPWHNYVQTFFDTATRSTIEHMMQELNTDPPEWIVYQRQLNIMKGSERLYNHGHPIAQRDLDTLIATKLASQQWTLVDQSDYLHPDMATDPGDTGWFIIRTRPPNSVPPAEAIVNSHP